jgi:hypothetical protein
MSAVQPSGRTSLRISHLSHACYMPLPPHYPWFDHPNNICWSCRTVVTSVFILTNWFLLFLQRFPSLLHILLRAYLDVAHTAAHDVFYSHRNLDQRMLPHGPQNTSVKVQMKRINSAPRTSNTFDGGCEVPGMALLQASYLCAYWEPSPSTYSPLAAMHLAQRCCLPLLEMLLWNSLQCCRHIFWMSSLSDLFVSLRQTLFLETTWSPSEPN